MENHKIPDHFMDPIDNLFLNIIGKPMVEYMNKYNMTPNMITSLGVVMRIISLYYLFRNFGNSKNSKILFFVFAMFGYLFDCLDGYYARKYNMCSKFGDYYDHASDLIYHIILVYYLFSKTKFTSSKYFVFITLFLIFLLIMTFTHLGCQEKYFTNTGDCHSETLNIFKKLCINPNIMKFTKYFGCGTPMVIFYLIIAYFKK